MVFILKTALNALQVDKVWKKLNKLQLFTDELVEIISLSGISTAVIYLTQTGAVSQRCCSVAILSLSWPKLLIKILSFHLYTIFYFSQVLIFVYWLQVRDAAILAIVEIYRHIGEKVRADLGKRGIPAAR